MKNYLNEYMEDKLLENQIESKDCEAAGTWNRSAWSAPPLLLLTTHLLAWEELRQVDTP